MDKKIKLNDVLCIMGNFFIKEFTSPADVEELAKIPDEWIIKTKTLENEKGIEFLKKAKVMPNFEEIKQDFDNFEDKFNLDYFKVISEQDVDEFYKQINFKKPLDLKSSHVANMLILLNILFKQDNNKNVHLILGQFLTNFCLPSIILLAKNMQKEAKSYFYKAVAELLIDYFKYIKEILGLRAEIE